MYIYIIVNNIYAYIYNKVLYVHVNILSMAIIFVHNTR